MQRTGLHPPPPLSPLPGSEESLELEGGAGQDPRGHSPVVAPSDFGLRRGHSISPFPPVTPPQGAAHLCRLFLLDPESDLWGHKRVLLSTPGLTQGHRAAQLWSWAPRGGGERRPQGREGTCLCGASSHSSSSCAGVRSSHSCGQRDRDRRWALVNWGLGGGGRAAGVTGEAGCLGHRGWKGDSGHEVNCLL